MGKHNRCSVCLCTFLLLGTASHLINSAYTNQRYGSSPVHRVSPEGSSKRGWYRHAAVALDNDICGGIAMEILRKNGSVVDAGIATQLCNGVVDQPHMGLGGGGTSLIYASPRDGGPKEMVIISGDSAAPSWMKPDIFSSVPDFKFPYKIKTSDVGTVVDIDPYSTISTGVPGELAGYYAAWKRYGKLPWKDVVAPSIAVARNGFPVTAAVERVLFDSKSMVMTSKNLKQFFADGELLYSKGDIMTDPLLASSLEAISEDPLSFYQGPLADEIIKDVQDFQGLLTKNDLKNFEPRWMTPINFTMMGGKYRAYLPGNPLSGELMAFVYNIIEGYNMTPDDLSTMDGMALFYHRYMEAWKFAYSHIDCIGDAASEYPLCVELLKKLTTKAYADEVRQLISDDAVQDTYKPEMSQSAKETPGTSHMSLVAEDGSVFSSTSSINDEFGNKKKGARTGIIFNDRLEDFTQTGSSSNLPGPNKLARSFQSPMLVTDDKGNPVLVIGGSGGSRIPNAVMQDMLMHLQFGLGLKEAIDTPRMFNLPKRPHFSVLYDAFDQEIITKVKARNHPSLKPVFPNKPYSGVVQGISMLSCHGCMESPSDCELPCIEAVSDYRKGGKPNGF